MKVKDLIVILQTMPQDAPVAIRDGVEEIFVEAESCQLLKKGMVIPYCKGDQYVWDQELEDGMDSNEDEGPLAPEDTVVIGFECEEEFMTLEERKAKYGENG